MQKRDLPMQTRLAAIRAQAPETVDGEDRTVDVVWTTGARVRRVGWDGPYLEELSLDSGAVDLSRLNDGAPLLDAHQAYSLSAVIGVVERAWIEDGEGRATVRFSDRVDVDPIWRDVRAGIIRNVSVGYAVHEFERVEDEGDIPVYRATAWEPLEISMVPIGADARAGTRAASELYPCVIVSGHTREESLDMAEQDVVTATDGSRNDTDTVEMAVAAERERISEIGRLARQAGADQALTDDLIARGVAVDAARQRLWDDLVARSAPHERTSRATIQVGDHDEVAFRRQHITDALLHRYAPDRFQLGDGARQYRGMRLADIARSCVEAAGVSTRGMTPFEVAGAAFGMADATRGGMHSTSDFPLLLANTANKVLRAAYDAVPRTFLPFSRQVTLPDFKSRTILQVGEAPQLLKVPEGGEITFGTIGEGSESFKLATYGRRIAMTRQMIVNDDLDAFGRLASAFGTSAATLENDLVWAQITANGAMGDGTALFHADHGNLIASGTAISVDSLGVAMGKLRLQTALDGVTKINLQPRYMLVPVGKMTLALQYLATITPNASSSVNPYAGVLTPIIEPRLDANSATAWYVVADPAQIDTIQYAYLEGQQGVRTETRQGWEVEGVEIKAVLDFAAKVIDWRGFVKNVGA